MKNLWFAIILLASGVTSAHAVSADLNLMNHYLIDAGDVVRVTVYDHADLTLEAEIAADGTLNVPLIGAVEVTGLNFKQVEVLIRQRLISGGFLKDPHVNVLITQYRSQLVSVLGEVNQPGRYPLTGDATLLAVLAAAGGISSNGGTQVMLIHDGQSHEYDLTQLEKGGQAINQVVVYPGDRVFVPRQKMIYVYGEVLRPGTYPLTNQMTVMKAVAVAGGFNGKADRDDIVLQRPSTLSSDEIDSQDITLSTLLQPEDVVYVNESLF